jgi:hypothetical protein
MTKLIITKRTPVVEEEEEEEKTYKCSDCDAWVTSTESCCGEEEDEDVCEVCDTKTKTTIKTYGCMDMSVCKNCEETTLKLLNEIVYKMTL